MNKGIERTELGQQAKVTVWQPGIYHRFHEDDTPQPGGPATLKATACRNERMSFQLAAVTDSADVVIRVACSTMAGAVWTVQFVDYVDTEKHGRVSDVLVEGPSRKVPPGRIQPIWLSLDVTRDMPAGEYRGDVTVTCGGENHVFPVELTVLQSVLPDLRDGTFYLDLWQHPAAVARWHVVPLWSDEHWELIREYTRCLAAAGQRPITATLIHAPWAGQTYDKFESLVQWIRQSDGSFTFDFSVLDRYVALCLEEGLRGPINCYSTAMGPGERMDCPIRYRDADTGPIEDLSCEVGDAQYVRAWSDFFEAFEPHLRERGWFDLTCIAIDEAPEAKMQAMLGVIPDQFRVTLAGNYHASLDARIYDYSVIYPGAPNEVAEMRREQGQITTFYTCCGPDFPNTFTFSPSVESRLLAWHALNRNCDGYLRWAFTSWPEDPFESSAWKPFPAGDTFLIYPGPCSSVRFELLKQGIQDYEAFRMAQAKSPNDGRLAEALTRANACDDGRILDAAELDSARALVNELL